MRRDFERTVRKLEEAQFFLKDLARTWDNTRAEALFHAFLSAARSTTFILQACLAEVPGFAPWWMGKQDVLRANPLARFFHDARTESQKLGIQALHYSGVATRLSARGVPQCRRRYRFWALEKAKTAVPTGNVVTVCQAYLQLVAGLLLEAQEQFDGLGDSGVEQRLRRVAGAKPPEPGTCPLHLKAQRYHRAQAKRRRAVSKSGKITYRVVHVVANASKVDVLGWWREYVNGPVGLNRGSPRLCGLYVLIAGGPLSPFAGQWWTRRGRAPGHGRDAEEAVVATAGREGSVGQGGRRDGVVSPPQGSQ